MIWSTPDTGSADLSTQQSRETIKGITLILVLAATIGASLWLRQSNFVPVVGTGVISYVFCSAGPTLLAADIVGTLVVLLAVHFAIRQRRLSRRPQASLLPSYRDVRCFRALFLIGINLVGLGVLWPPLAGWWAAFAYIAIDLHLVVILVAVALFVLELEAISEGALRRRLEALAVRLRNDARLLLGEVSVAATAITLVIVCSPMVRFSSIVVGDEPKYLRYCESWWQGLGVDIERVRDVSSIPVGEPSHFGRTLAMLGPALRQAIVSLAADVKFLGNWKRWGHQFNKSEYVGGGFIRGKQGGLYEMHSPGIAAIILPAYIIDRSWFDLRTSKFADDLFTVNLAFLMMFAALAIAVFRLAHAYDASPLVAMTVAIAVALSLPIGAFPFLFYPEMLAGLIVCLLCCHLIAPAPLRYPIALFAGLGLGLLTWLHLRFGGLAFVGLGWLVWTHRRDRGRLAAALSMFVLLTAGLCLYAYHITGSILPSAPYLPPGGWQQFDASAVPRGLLSVVFDRTYGLLPLNPMFLCALPGLGLMWRTNRRALGVLLTFALALVIPTSGHDPALAGTTPLRFVLAVVPLGALPLAEWLRTISRRPVLITFSVGAIALSLRNGLAHDIHFDKTTFTMVDAGFSGWNPSLLFPVVAWTTWIPRDYDSAVLMIWIGVAAAAILWGLASTPRQGIVPRVSPARVAGLTAAFLVTVAVLGALAAAGGGPRRDASFLSVPQPPEEVKRMTVGGCWLTRRSAPAPF